MKNAHPKRNAIAFRVLNGKLVHLVDDRPISEIEEGATGEVIVNKKEITLLPPGTTLLARIRPTKAPQSDEGIVQVSGRIGTAAIIVLQEELRLSFQTKKDGQLLPCKCRVPSLLNARQPSSVNEAYSTISEHFEPHRRSHTGNVFSCVFYQVSPQVWRPLDELRNSKRNE